jgi:hypothetical protein
VKLKDRLPALPYVLLGGMTLVSFGGPIAMLILLWGGASDKWPPDRAIEWIAVSLIFGLVITLFVACVSISLWYYVEGKVSADGETSRADSALPESGATPNLINQESTG